MRPYHLFVTQCLDRIERSRFPRGIKPKENSDRGANEKCDHDRGGGNQRRPISRQRDCFRSCDAEKDSENSPDRAKRNRFDQKLRENVAPVTLTSMIFMIPMPPTTSETPAIAPSNPVITSVVAVAASAISC